MEACVSYNLSVSPNPLKNGIGEWKDGREYAFQIFPFFPNPLKIKVYPSKLLNPTHRTYRAEFLRRVPHS